MNASSPDQRLTVWATAQQSFAAQRRGRYLPESSAHPAKMLPAIAAHAIDAYTGPGDWVLDPMCGIGTTLVEAVHAGRHGIGVEYESRWAAVARANLDLAAAQGAPGTGRVAVADARWLPVAVPPELHGRIALVVTSPPYGASVHGRVRSTRDSGEPGIHKHDHTYGADKQNLAHQPLPRLLAGFTAILTGCAQLLRPGGTVVVTTRPWRRNGELVDLPGLAAACGRDAGLRLEQRCVALLAAIRDDRLRPRPSFFALNNARKARATGQPQALIVHEDALVFTRPPFPGSSREPRGARGEFTGTPGRPHGDGGPEGAQRAVP